MSARSCRTNGMTGIPKQLLTLGARILSAVRAGNVLHRRSIAAKSTESHIPRRQFCTGSLNLFCDDGNRRKPPRDPEKGVMSATMATVIGVSFVLIMLFVA